MHIRRPLAALFTALALFGGGATMTACQAAGQDQNDGTTDDSENTGGNDPGSEEQGNLPDNSQPDTEGGDGDEDDQDPD
ncbi:hypothetical protein DQ244_11640 [Blastococcus sp. TBT05-19]|uniref:hypothetical protein n=1 Tax=Blastococcus sp. TBT05-19 TaxID=2250581 RepID=UPI000DEBAC84|nr:hypothetical protein [Blastococcus sp. TBT05-19]RBY90122.1 hypothetical protein DQ244_11640 [Blastococcus sp. TBT05-19]